MTYRSEWLRLTFAICLTQVGAVMLALWLWLPEQEPYTPPPVVCQCRYDVEMPERLRGIDYSIKYAADELAKLKRCEP